MLLKLWSLIIMRHHVYAMFFVTKQQ